MKLKDQKFVFKISLVERTKISLKNKDELKATFRVNTNIHIILNLFECLG